MSTLSLYPPLCKAKLGIVGIAYHRKTHPSQTGTAGSLATRVFRHQRRDRAKIATYRVRDMRVFHIADRLVISTVVTLLINHYGPKLLNVLDRRASKLQRWLRRKK